MQLLPLKRNASRTIRRPGKSTRRDLPELIQVEESNLPCSGSGKGTCEQSKCRLRVFCFSGG